MLLHRTRVQFLTPTWLFTTTCNSSSRRSDDLFGEHTHTQTYHTHTLTHTHTHTHTSHTYTHPREKKLLENNYTNKKESSIVLFPFNTSTQKQAKLCKLNDCLANRCVFRILFFSSFSFFSFSFFFFFCILGLFQYLFKDSRFFFLLIYFF